MTRSTRVLIIAATLPFALHGTSEGGEYGANDFRISEMGPAEPAGFNARTPAVAYNPAENEYFVVWGAFDNLGNQEGNELETYGQRIDADTGAELGANDIRLSDMGPQGEFLTQASEPDVAYNSVDGEYMVVWTGREIAGNPGQVHCQRVDAASGLEIGSNDFSITSVPATFDAASAAIVHNPERNEYVVAWLWIDDEFDFSNVYATRIAADGTILGETAISTGGSETRRLSPDVAYSSVEDEYLISWSQVDYSNDDEEIRARRISDTGSAIGAQFTISDMGPNNDDRYQADEPAITYNSSKNEYFVVWAGSDNLGGLQHGEYEIFGQAIDASTGNEVGTNDMRISFMGGTGDPADDAVFPGVTYNAAVDEYFVVWAADGDLADDENEVYCQRIVGTTGVLTGAASRLSDVGDDLDAGDDAAWPAVAGSTADGDLLVVWFADEPAYGNGVDHEIFGQRISKTGDEVGSNDFRISDAGGDEIYDADVADVAYNPVLDEYFVVWEADGAHVVDDEDSPILEDEKFEIFGQRIDAATGLEIGIDDQRISYTPEDGPTGAPHQDALTPAIAFDPVTNRYLVVWSADEPDENREIWGQILEASGGRFGTHFVISDMGDESNTYLAREPAVAAGEGVFYVVWEGDDDTIGNNDFEIFGQMIDAATGNEIGPNDARLSNIGPDGNSQLRTYQPAVAYNPSAEEFLVAWAGDMNPFEAEIFVQRVDLTGSEVGTNDLRVSQAGPDGSSSYDAVSPSIAYNSAVNEYLVAWSGSDDAPPLVAGELEIFVQRLDGNSAAEIGGDLRVSDLGPDGDPDYNASSPDVAYDSAADVYLVTWSGDDDEFPLAANESEIFGQFLDGTAQEIGDNDFRLSDAGADGVGSQADAIDPAVATGTGSTFLTVWDANDDTVSPMTYEENEIFGQFVAADVAADIVTNDDALGPLRALRLGPVRPNPARHRAEVVLHLARPTQARARLIDLTGRAVLTFGSQNLEAGTHVMALPLREGGVALPAGVYFLEVVGGDMRASRKVIVK